MKNFKLMILLFLTISFYSCEKYKENLNKEAEKIIITFYGIIDDRIIENYTTTEISDKNEITKIINFLANRNSPAYKCGYQGKIDFYCKNNIIILEMMFNTNCNTMVFEYNNKFFSKKYQVTDWNI